MKERRNIMPKLQLTQSDPWRTAREAGEQACSRAGCVAQQVAKHAVVNPKRLAVATCNESVAYAELEDQSNRLARHLRSLGAGKNAVVAICLPRSAPMVVGTLGVLKAGAAYLPLDPAYPVERLARMLNDAQPAVLVTQEPLAQRLPSGPWRILNLGSDKAEIASHTGDSFDWMSTLEDLAYVIYTSGSTGRPKGVQITHGGLLNLVLWHQQAFNVGPSDRASQLASPSFDAAVWEVWPYLAAGASVHVPDDSIRTDPESLRDWMLSEGITIGFVPTPLAERMIALKWPRKTALRVLLTGADALRRYPPRGLPFTLVNNYGPTECTVVATSGPVVPNGRSDVPPSIGRPISNVEIYILDEKLQQVPAGVSGEMYIGGAGVARGYRNSPELTAEKFVANPFGTPSSARLYRTGDLGCYLPDGQIAFLGRVDEQIKIRGYRIEPNEIIHALDEHSTVEASLVVAREDAPGEKRLVGYVVPKPGTPPAGNSLREFLSNKLPDHMIPAVFVRIDRIPLNGSGKIDRAALPKPDDANSLHFDTYIAPRTLTEQRIAQILAQLLGIERVGVEDNFFLLGGHSLLGTQLIARIRDTFGVGMSLRTLFDSPTIAALAAEVERLLYIRLEAMSEEEAEQLLKGQAETAPGAV